MLPILFVSEYGDLAIFTSLEDWREVGNPPRLEKCTMPLPSQAKQNFSSH